MWTNHENSISRAHFQRWTKLLCASTQAPYFYPKIKTKRSVHKSDSARIRVVYLYVSIHCLSRLDSPPPSWENHVTSTDPFPLLFLLFNTAPQTAAIGAASGSSELAQQPTARVCQLGIIVGTFRTPRAQDALGRLCTD